LIDGIGSRASPRTAEAQPLDLLYVSSATIAEIRFGTELVGDAKGARRPADVVNLGFVLNVIEDPRERTETLKAAWSLHKRCFASR
jgi:hypothetical protein